MFLTVLIVFFSLITLVVLHELGHFILAKKFGVRVEEFGIGLPPRIFGRKFGETIYSLNLLPFGAFVRISGEDEEVKTSDSFSEKPIWQRMLIILGGIISFWLVAFLIFTFIAGVWGLPKSVSDEFVGPAQVQIVEVAKNSPAEISGIKIGDKIIGLGNNRESCREIDKMKGVQEFIGARAGQEIVLVVERGKEVLNFNLIPRQNADVGKGAIGVGLARISYLKSNWYEAPIKGILITGEKTVQIPLALKDLIQKTLNKEKVEGAELIGPIGVGNLMSKTLRAGTDKFLFFLAMISLWLALVNILPLPALDGGRLLFLALEGIRGKKISQIIEQKITAFFYLFLILLMIFVSIKDIMKFF